MSLSIQPKSNSHLVSESREVTGTPSGPPSFQQRPTTSSISSASNQSLSFCDWITHWIQRIFSYFSSSFDLNRRSVHSTKTYSLRNPEERISAAREIIVEHLSRGNSAFQSELDPRIPKSPWGVILGLRNEERTTVFVRKWSDPDRQLFLEDQAEAFLRNNPNSNPIYIFTWVLQKTESSKINHCNSFTTLLADGSTSVVTEARQERGQTIAGFTRDTNRFFQNPDDRIAIQDFIKQPSS